MSSQKRPRGGGCRAGGGYGGGGGASSSGGSGPPGQLEAWGGGGGGGRSTALAATVGNAELDAARQSSSDSSAAPGQTYMFYHGTSWDVAERILRDGFQPSTEGCLGPGIYVARREKAERFAREAQPQTGRPRHDQAVGALVEVLVTVRNPKFVEVNPHYNYTEWRAAGHDSCRAECTTGSTNPEWCIGDRSQVQVIRTVPIRCDAVDVDEEERELEKHAAVLEAEIQARANKVATMREWVGSIKRKRDEEQAEKERLERERLAVEAREGERQRREEERQQAAETARQQQQMLEAKRYARGKCMAFVLHEGDHVSKLWSGGDAVCVAMGCSGDRYSSSVTAMLYEKGGHAWSSCMPKLLHNKLNGRGEGARPWTTYLSMGSDGRYFLKFDDGTSEWVGSDSLEEKILENKPVKRVAFGEDYETYFVLSELGGYSWNGIPSTMSAGINSNKYRKRTIDEVSLGPNGEWFVRWTDGSWKADGLPEHLDAKLAKFGRGSSNIRQILFGPSDTWFIRYN